MTWRRTSKYTWRWRRFLIIRYPWRLWLYEGRPIALDYLAINRRGIYVKIPFTPVDVVYWRQNGNKNRR